MRVLLIVNPFASSVTDRRRQDVHDALAAGHDVTERRSERRDHAMELSGEARGFDAIVALGGDGTISEVASGMAASRSEAILVPLPGGSTNVFARTVGVDAKLPKAAAQIVQALDRGQSQELVVSTANGRCILFHVGLGFDAAVVARVERLATLKRKIGQSVFVYATFTTWLKHFDRRRPHFAVHFPDGTSVEDGYYGICLNSDPYTYFGRRPLSIGPEAGRGGLVAVTVRTLDLAAMLGLFNAALRGGGRLARHPQVDYRVGVQSLTVVSDQPFPYQVDGDYLGDVTRLEIVHGAHRLRLLEVEPAS